MKELTKKEKFLLYCACFRKKYRYPSMVISFIFFYIIYGDLLYSATIAATIFLFFHVSYKYYGKYAGENRDALLAVLEESGRKELAIPDESEAFHLFKKTATCDLPAKPTNIKEFTLVIVFLGKEHLTLYSKCPKLHIYNLEMGAKPKKGKAKMKSACAENREYYYSNMMGAYYDTTNKKISVALKVGGVLEIECEKAPATKIINKIRAILRK